MISTSQLHDFSQCSHRVSLDVFGDPLKRDESDPFVQMLWECGNAHKGQIVTTLPVLDLTNASPTTRERETIAAMKRGEPLIYGGQISSGDLIGMPNLLEFRGGAYIPGDIKSGSGLESTGGGGYKEHYAFRLAHYIQILENIGLSDGSREAFIIDRTGQRVPYLLMEPQGIRNTTTWWDGYQQAAQDVRALIGGGTSRSALAAACKLCHWHTHCKQECINTNDLTLIAELGRAKRDAMAGMIPTVASLAACDPKAYITGKKTAFPGIGPDLLLKFHERAKLLSTPGSRPYLKRAVTFPVAAKEVFFDIEADPMRDIVYLHGFVERPHEQPAGSKFNPFYSEGIDAGDEEAAFADAWAYLSARVLDSTVYYYSAYERTAYKKLAGKYPGVCSVDEVVTLFDLPAMIDLYGVVRKDTEWPTYNQSIKTLAQYLGFQWRDTHPSGAASIEWYNRWVESGDMEIKNRILDYNEDDCLATGVLLDGIRAL